MPIPLRITMVQAKVNGKPVIVHYVEDISLIRNMEEDAISQMRAFDDEKGKMQNCMFLFFRFSILLVINCLFLVMYNMFPKSIAEQLMVNNPSGNQHLMAEEYKEVTILFADIAGFTNMCSHLEPAVLLVILNGYAFVILSFSSQNN